MFFLLPVTAQVFTIHNTVLISNRSSFNMLSIIQETNILVCTNSI